MPKDGRGWHKEPVRHGLAARGVKTGRKSPTPKARESMDKLAQKLVGEIGQERELRTFLGDLRAAETEAVKRWTIYRRARGKSKETTLERAYEAEDEVAQVARIVQNVFEKIDRKSGLPKSYREISRLELGVGPGIQKLYRFKNNMGASVIMNPSSHGGDMGLWEIRVVKWFGPGKEGYSVVFDDSIPFGAEHGWLQSGGVKDLLAAIERLPKSA